jgi:hypothetical protein
LKTKFKEISNGQEWKPDIFSAAATPAVTTAAPAQTAVKVFFSNNIYIFMGYIIIVITCMRVFVYKNINNKACKDFVHLKNFKISNLHVKF